MDFQSFDTGIRRVLARTSPGITSHVQSTMSETRFVELMTTFSQSDSR